MIKLSGTSPASILNHLIPVLKFLAIGALFIAISATAETRRSAAGARCSPIRSTESCRCPAGNFGYHVCQKNKVWGACHCFGDDSIPTGLPTNEPTSAPTVELGQDSTQEPTTTPTDEPTPAPTAEPTDLPTDVATDEPTVEPTEEPTEEPTDKPTEAPTVTPAPCEDGARRRCDCEDGIGWEYCIDEMWSGECIECEATTPTGTPTVGDTPIPTPTSDITTFPTATEVPSASPTSSPTSNSTTSPTATGTPTSSPSSTPSPTPTETPTPTPPPDGELKVYLNGYQTDRVESCSQSDDYIATAGTVIDASWDVVNTQATPWDMPTDCEVTFTRTDTGASGPPFTTNDDDTGNYITIQGEANGACNLSKSTATAKVAIATIKLDARTGDTLYYDKAYWPDKAWNSLPYEIFPKKCIDADVSAYVTPFFSNLWQNELDDYPFEFRTTRDSGVGSGVVNWRNPIWYGRRRGNPGPSECLSYDCNANYNAFGTVDFLFSPALSVSARATYGGITVGLEKTPAGFHNKAFSAPWKILYSYKKIRGYPFDEWCVKATGVKNTGTGSTSGPYIKTGFILNLDWSQYRIKTGAEEDFHGQQWRNEVPYIYGGYDDLWAQDSFLTLVDQIGNLAGGASPPWSCRFFRSDAENDAKLIARSAMISEYNMSYGIFESGPRRCYLEDRAKAAAGYREAWRYVDTYAGDPDWHCPATAAPMPERRVPGKPY